MTMRKNTVKLAMNIKHIVDTYYEPGNQSKCMRQVWRKYVTPIYPCCLSTFYRLLQFAIKLDGFIGMGGNRVNIGKSTQIDNIINN